MAITLKSTKDVHSNGLKALVYGQSGAGKTTLGGSMPSPVILSAEGGLLALAGKDVPYIEISSMADLREAYQWLTSEEAAPFQSVVLDSISEIAEVVLAFEKKNNKDARQAYGQMQEQMTEIIRAFRDLPNKHVLFIAKVEKTQDEQGRVIYAPSMPGNKLGQSLPYFFDEVLALRTERDPEGNIQRMVMTQPDGLWTAKDRSGKLESWELPDMTGIINKIEGK